MSQMEPSKRPFGKKIRTKVLAKFSGKCAYCGKDITLKTMQVDHIIPKSKSGTDDMANLNPSCGACNAVKCSATIDEFRIRYFRKTMGIPWFTPEQREYLKSAYGIDMDEENKKRTGSFYFETVAEGINEH